MLTTYANHQIGQSGKGIARTVCENANKFHFVNYEKAVISNQTDNSACGIYNCLWKNCYPFHKLLLINYYLNFVKILHYPQHNKFQHQLACSMLYAVDEHAHLHNDS